MHQPAWGLFVDISFFASRFTINLLRRKEDGEHLPNDIQCQNPTRYIITIFGLWLFIPLLYRTVFAFILSPSLFLLAVRTVSYSPPLPLSLSGCPCYVSCTSWSPVLTLVSLCPLFPPTERPRVHCMWSHHPDGASGGPTFGPYPRCGLTLAVG